MIRFAHLSVASLVLAGVVAADDPPKPPAKSDSSPAASAPATQNSAKPQKPDAPTAVDAELLRSLDKQLAPIEPEHPLVRVGTRMRDVQVRLTKTDAGDETQSLQKGIVEDLDKLIEQAKKGGG